MGNDPRRFVQASYLDIASLNMIPGGRINGASSAYNAEEMAYALKTAKSKFLFTLPNSLDIAVAAAKAAGMSQECVFLLEGRREGFASIQQLIEQGKQYTPDPCYSIPTGKTNKEICGYLNFSSGTTGHPKAVMLSHHNIIAQCHQLRQVQVIEPGEQLRALAVTPLFHITGMFNTPDNQPYSHTDSIRSGPLHPLPNLHERQLHHAPLLHHGLHAPHNHRLPNPRTHPRPTNHHPPSPRRHSRQIHARPPPYSKTLVFRFCPHKS